MEIILKKDVENLGYTYDVVKVKHGYARNYLIPQGFAVLATPSAKKELAEILKQRKHKLDKIVNDAETLAKALTNVSLKVAMKANEDGKIFGSVTNSTIAEALLAQFKYEIESKKIVVPGDHIKALGSYEIKVKLHKDVEPIFKLDVIAEEEK